MARVTVWDRADSDEGRSQTFGSLWSHEVGPLVAALMRAVDARGSVDLPAGSVDAGYVYRIEIDL